MENNWSDQQRTAIDTFNDWLEDRSSPLFSLYGYAGTGKTTLLRYLASTKSVGVCAFTGKAALVLRKKGCHHATTIHSMIYHIFDDPVLRQELWKLRNKRASAGGLSMDDSVRLLELQKKFSQPEFVLNENAFVIGRDGERIDPPDFIAVDEASMVDETIGEDLLSFGIPLLAVMDPAQLPPIKGTGYFTTATPDVMLTEIHRQAWDSDIIQLATAVREDRIRRYNYGNFGDVQVVGSVPPDWYRDPESQLLCGRNVTRFGYNAQARSGLGFKNELPEKGDKLCCWRNNHGEGLLNGSFWHTLDVDHRTKFDEFLELKIRSEDDPAIIIDCVAHKRNFLEADPYKNEDWDWQERLQANEFSYGYALTVHKAQGSEWNNVILVDESYLWGDRAKRWWGGDRNKWLYTGITRASEKLTLIKT
jgi:exodeoxyribonuclease V